MTTHFSEWEDHERIAQDAHTVGCKELVVLVNQNTRTSYATLKSMNLVIHTTTWWGNHPSMVYYSGMPTNYYYSVSEFEKQMLLSSPTRCFTMEVMDWNEDWRLRILSKNSTFYLGVMP